MPTIRRDDPNRLKRDIEFIDQKIAELKALKRIKMRGDDRRQKLLKLVKDGNWNRSDVWWCYNNMPYTDPSRTAKALQSKGHKPSRPEDLDIHIKRRGNKARPVRAELIAGGERLRRLRKAKGLTAEDIAKKLGIHESTIGTWERGEWAIKPENVKALEDILGEKL